MVEEGTSTPTTDEEGGELRCSLQIRQPKVRFSPQWHWKTHSYNEDG